MSAHSKKWICMEAVIGWHNRYRLIEVVKLIKFPLGEWIHSWTCSSIASRGPVGYVIQRVNGVLWCNWFEYLQRSPITLREFAELVSTVAGHCPRKSSEWMPIFLLLSRDQHRSKSDKSLEFQSKIGRRLIEFAFLATLDVWPWN